MSDERYRERQQRVKERVEARVAGLQLRVRKAPLEIPHERFGIVAEQDRANAAHARRDENRAERALSDGEPQRGAAAARPDRAGHHPELALRVRVETTARAEARRVKRSGYGGAAFELRAHPGGAQSRRVRARRDAGGFLENALQVKARETRGRGQLRERRDLLRLLDEAARARDRGRTSVRAPRVRAGYEAS